MKPLLTIFCVLLYCIGKTQTDYTISIDQLTFHSALEEQFFRGEIDDPVAGLVMINPLYTEESLNELRAELRLLFDEIVRKSNKRSVKKTAKYVFQTVHDDYFSSYHDLVMFDEIFSKGVYNCVSATALYGLVFGHLNIPFEVLSTENHVFMILTPPDGMILIESTDPVDGYNKDFEAQQAKLLKEYKKHKLVDKEGRLTTSLGEENWTIEFNDLIGLQYYNKSIELYNEGDVMSALRYANKSYFLSSDPSYTIDYLNLLNRVAISNNELSLLERADCILQVALIDSTLSGPVIRDELVSLADVAADAADTLLIREIVGPFRKIGNKDLKIDVIENALIGQVFLGQNKYHEAEPFLLKAFALEPEDDWLQRNVRFVLLYKAQDVNSMDASIKQLENYIADNKHLANNTTLLEVQLLYYIAHSINYFSINSYDTGMKLMLKADNLLEQGVRTEPNLIGSMYYQCWRICTRRNAKSDADKWLNRGLEFNKFHEDLNRVKNY